MGRIELIGAGNSKQTCSAFSSLNISSCVGNQRGVEGSRIRFVLPDSLPGETLDRSHKGKNETQHTRRPRRDLDPIAAKLSESGRPSHATADPCPPPVGS